MEGQGWGRQLGGGTGKGADVARAGCSRRPVCFKLHAEASPASPPACTPPPPTPPAGEVEFLISDVLNAPAQTLELPLMDMEKGRQLAPECVVVLRAQAMPANDNRVVGAWGGVGFWWRG